MVLVAGVDIAYSQSLETYENSLSGFKFQYPTEWKPVIVEGSNGVSFDLYPESGENRTDVFVVAIPMHNSLHQYFREYMGEQSGIDYSTLRTNEFIVSNFPGIMATWNIVDDTGTLAKALSVFAIRDRTLYRIHYEIPPEFYDKFFPQVQNLIKSFQITGKPSHVFPENFK